MVHRDELTDEFDEVTVCEDYIERERRENDMWKEIEDFFDANEIVDKVHYSQIEDLKFQPESAYPLIKIKIDGKWRKLPLEDEEQAKKVFKRLRYRYRAFLQNN